MEANNLFIVLHAILLAKYNLLLLFCMKMEIITDQIQDPNSGDWVVYRHDLETPSFLGYFPIELCPKMPVIQALTGFVNYFNTTQGPPMGSGHFPDRQDSNKKVAYFKQIKKYNSGGHPYDPWFVKMLYIVDRPDCYKESDFAPVIHEGYLFHYGGPSGCIG
jgi:hypothetical protein